MGSRTQVLYRETWESRLVCRDLHSKHQSPLMKHTETLSVYIAESQAITQHSFTVSVTDKVSVCVCWDNPPHVTLHISSVTCAHPKVGTHLVSVACQPVKELDEVTSVLPWRPPVATTWWHLSVNWRLFLQLTLRFLDFWTLNLANISLISQRSTDTAMDTWELICWIINEVGYFVHDMCLLHLQSFQVFFLIVRPSHDWMNIKFICFSLVERHHRTRSDNKKFVLFLQPDRCKLT